MQGESLIPIDIQTNKLLDWLISRRHCNKDWQDKALVVREKINAAIQDMPEVEEITNLLAGTYIHYFHCQRIVEILKDTEASTKNLFGRYSSQRMKDWLEILRLYEKDSVYLAEAAQMLIRTVNYEVPAMKRQITKCQQIQEEAVKKEADYAKHAQELRDRYQQECKQLGIKGEFVKKELLSLLDELPGLFGGAVEALRKVQPAVDLYRLFLGFTLASSKVDASTALPLTQFLISHGNTTTYEWRHGEPPEVVEESRPVLPVDLDNGNGEDQELANQRLAAEVKTLNAFVATQQGGEEEEEVVVRRLRAEDTFRGYATQDGLQKATAKIDFGDFDLGNGSCDSIATSPNGDFVHVGHGDGEEAIEVLGDDSAISWDISVEADGTAADGAAPKVVEEQPSQGGAKVARGADALSLLHNPETRTQFFNELQELECFLSQWLTEMLLDGDALSASVLQQAPAEVQLQSRESVQSHLDVVKSCVSSLTAVRMQHLYQLHSSPKYVDRLVDTLQQKLYQADKNLQSREAVAARRQEALEEQRQLQPKLDLILAKTRQLQKQVQEDISKRYKGRPVNIMGGINVM